MLLGDDIYNNMFEKKKQKSTAIIGSIKILQCRLTI